MDLLRVTARVARDCTDPTAHGVPQPQPSTLDAQQAAKVREAFLAWSGPAGGSGPEEVERFVAAVRDALAG